VFKKDVPLSCTPFSAARAPLFPSSCPLFWAFFLGLVASSVLVRFRLRFCVELFMIVEYYHVFVDKKLAFVSLDAEEAVKFAAKEFKESFKGCGYGDNVQVVPYSTKV